MGIDVDLKPAVDRLVLHLDGVHKGSRTIGLDEVLGRSRPAIVGGIEGRLHLGNKGGRADGSLGRRNRG